MLFNHKFLYERNESMKNLAKVFAAVAMLASSAASLGCVWFISDEPVAPKNFID